MRPRVVYWNHSPTPYFVARFNAVVRRGGLDFEAWFNDRREPIRSWDVDEREWLFPARYIPRRPLLGWSERVPVPELLERRPDVLVQECDRAHLAAGFLAGTALARRTAFRALPSYDAWSERTWWRELGKRFVFRAVDAAKVPGATGERLAGRYGLPAERIGRVTQSVDVATLAQAAAIEPAERERRRRELGLAGCVFIYAGRLWHGKGTDDLLSAYEALARDGESEISLLLLGDGPDEGRYRELARTLPRVAFAGFVQAREIASFYALADALVFPTLGDPHGLVVEEAMASGLPVISSARAGDIEQRLGHGRAGRVVTPRDPAALAGAMRELAADPALRARLAAEARAIAASQTHERYAEQFEAFVLSVLDRPPRAGANAALARAGGRLLARAARTRPPAPLLRGQTAARAAADA